MQDNEYKDYILRCLRQDDGDDLERAKAVFRNHSQADLDKKYGQSGKTCREILAGYENARNRNKEVTEWFKNKF